MGTEWVGGKGTGEDRGKGGGYREHSQGSKEHSTENLVGSEENDWESEGVRDWEELGKAWAEGQRIIGEAADRDPEEKGREFRKIFGDHGNSDAPDDAR